MWFLILASLVSSARAVAQAAATDPACTADTATPPVKLSPAALACEDVDSGVCKSVFGDASTLAGRAAKCIQDDPADATKPDPNLKKFAIERCAKHCGYCCLRPEYTCDNKPYALTGINCSTLADKCTDPTWKTLIAQNCPNTCGLCLEGGCVDKVDCASQKTICYNVKFVTFAKENCARTCGQCPPPVVATTAVSPVGSATAAPASGICVDMHSQCGIWAGNGKFCNNPWHQSQWHLCRRSCGRC